MVCDSHVLDLFSKVFKRFATTFVNVFVAPCCTSFYRKKIHNNLISNSKVWWEMHTKACIRCLSYNFNREKYMGSFILFDVKKINEERNGEIMYQICYV